MNACQKPPVHRELIQIKKRANTRAPWQYLLFGNLFSAFFAKFLMQITRQTKSLRRGNQQQNTERERDPLAPTVQNSGGHDHAEERARETVFWKDIDLGHM